MNRRTFLRVLGSAAVGAVIAQALPPLPVPASAQSWWASQAGSGSGPPLSMAMLREAFDKCSRGGNSPQHLITTKAVQEQYESLARKCGLVFDLDVAA